MKFPPSAAALVFLAFSMKAVAFPGFEMKGSEAPASPNERAQRTTTDSSDSDSAAAYESDIGAGGSVAGIA